MSERIKDRESPYYYEKSGFIAPQDLERVRAEVEIRNRKREALRAMKSQEVHLAAEGYRRTLVRRPPKGHKGDIHFLLEEKSINDDLLLSELPQSSGSNAPDRITPGIQRHTNR